MKHNLRSIKVLTLLLGVQFIGFAQYKLGTTKDFFTKTKSAQTNSGAKVSGSTSIINAQVEESKSLQLQVQYQRTEKDQSQYVAGTVKGYKSGTFLIKSGASSLSGHILLKQENKAFEYYSENGDAFIRPVDIHDLLCIEYTPQPATPATPSTAQIGTAEANLQSFPGARGCVLLDFDGQYVSGTPWNGGNPINAAHSGMSDADIREAWEIVSEDFRPFSINVTTSEAVFNSYPKNMRMRNIFTPTNTAAPGAGGVAYIGSFNWNDDTPCWVFILSGKAGGEAASHEVGHTFGLGHDGRNSPSEGYFAGHGDWAPIMGVGYYKPVSQWSRGEYNSANNGEDDIAKIASGTYNVGYRNDDHGNGISNATTLRTDGNGGVSTSLNFGIIERTSDQDFFSINAGSGTINLNVNTVGRHGDLDIIVRLYNASGSVIGTYNPGGLNSSLSANVSAGTYYISVDGTGAGNPATDGYSDYASLGSFFISGSVPKPNVSTTGLITVFKDCNFSGTSTGLGEGNFTLGQLQAAGILDNDISSLRVALGYEAVLYEHDNFTGASVTVRGEDGCLVDNSFNDIVSSIRIRTYGVTNIAGTFSVQNRNSGLVMDVNGNNNTNGAAIMQYTSHGGLNQQFEFTHLGNGTYKIIAKHSGQSMDINSFSTANGARVEQYPFHGATNQQFIVHDIGGGFYKIIAKNAGKVVEVGGMSTAPGTPLQIWDDAGQTSAHWKLNVVAPPAFTQLIEAESFIAMAGIQTEATTDAGGGSNVGYIETGDWMAYGPITIPSNGTYKIEYRVASVSGGKLSLDINSGATVLGMLNIPATGGWQNWTTISHNVSMNAGTYNFGVYAQTGGWNINWWRVTKVSGARSSDDAFVLDNAAEVELLELFPNPAEDKLMIEAPFELESKVYVISSDGRKLSYDVKNGNTIDLTGLNPGVYTLVTFDHDKTIVKRFVKK